MPDNQKLIEAIAAFDATEGVLPDKPQAAYAVVEAARLAVIEKAHTPTGEGRKVSDRLAPKRPRNEGHAVSGERVSLASLIKSFDGWDADEVARYPEAAAAVIADLTSKIRAVMRAPEVPGGETWQVAIEAERERQIAKGYTAEHDARHGIRHLLCWAIDYDRRGKTLEASALKRAALDLLPREPQGEPSDAQADEAQRGYHAFAFGPEEVDVFLTPERLAKGRDAWKAALRAAGGVR